MSVIINPLVAGTSGNSAITYEGTWASRPAATSVTAGAKIRITDVGVGGYSEWVSDGTYWRPVNGSVLLECRAGSVSSPVTSLTGNGTIQQYILPRDILLPAGMLIPGSQLEVLMVGRKVGTTGHTGSFLGCLSDSPVPASPSLWDFYNLATNATNPSIARMPMRFGVYANGWLESQAISPFAPGNSATDWVEHADVGINSANRYISFFMGSSFVDGTGSILQYSVALLA